MVFIFGSLFCRNFPNKSSWILFFLFLQSSLMRQDCLEQDQHIVALLSMVQHIEVRLKQQQQSVGRSLMVLDDIICHVKVIFKL